MGGRAPDCREREGGCRVGRAAHRSRRRACGPARGRRSADRYLSALSADIDSSDFVGDPPVGSTWPHCFTPVVHWCSEAGRPHPRQRGRRCLDAGRELVVGLGRRRLRCPAAVPCQCRDGHAAGAAVQGPGCGVGRPARLSRPGTVQRILEDRRALPHRVDERSAHRLRGLAQRRSTPTSVVCASPWWERRLCRPRSPRRFRTTRVCPCSKATD